MTALATLVFQNFWTTVALGAATGTWALWCWFARPALSPAAHLAAVAGLAAAYRLAAEACEQERGRRPLLRGVGMTTLALGFSSFAGAAALGAFALAWWALDALSVWPAEAGALAAASPLATPGFRMLGSLAAAGGSLALLHGYVRGHRQLDVERRRLAVPGLPPALGGLRLVHLSDIHVGPLADAAALARAIAAVDALDADLICVTGDLVDSPRTDLDAWVPVLARLRARRGVYAVLGNHDRHAGAERVAAAITRGTDWRLLRDEVASIDVGGTLLHVLGLDDRPVPEARAVLPALLGRVPAGEPSVLLCHHPDVFDDAAAAGVPLMLAGHTHGGQLAVPGLPQLNVASLLISRRSVGWYRQDGQYLHVSAGLGVSGQRVRLAMPRRVTEITLAAAPRAGRSADDSGESSVATLPPRC